MGQEHHHHHAHSAIQKLNSHSLTTAFYVGIVLNSLFVIVELIYGISQHSLSLLSDAGHNLFDVLCLVLALISVWLCKVKTSEQYAFGYKKVSIIVAFFNSAVLLISVFVIFYEAILRLKNPAPLQGKTIAIVALAGILVNGVSALFFLSHKQEDVNVKSAYWHLLADMLLSLAVCIGGVVIYYTGYTKIDALLSMLISVIIAWSSWKLLKESFELLIGKTPASVNKSEISKLILDTRGVKTLKLLRIWAVSTNEFAAHINVELEEGFSTASQQEIKVQICQSLKAKQITYLFWEIC